MARLTALSGAACSLLLGLLLGVASTADGQRAAGAPAKPAPSAKQPAPSPAKPAGTPEQNLLQRQNELNQLRQERAELESRMTALKKNAQSLRAEVANIEAQRATTARLVAALDRQLETIEENITVAESRLRQTEAELTDKRGDLQQRLTSIYKRGQLFDAEVLLSSQSFAALVARYKYLHEVALYDRRMVRGVEALRNRIIDQRALLERLQQQIEGNRQEKAQEVQRLRSLEAQRQRSLTGVRAKTVQTQERLAQLVRDEARVASVIAAIETARRKAAASSSAKPIGSTIRTADLGTLDWPVDGDILYRFGKVVNPNNTTTRWNGIGIGATAGTAVRAIAAGTVVLAENVGTYGPTVIIQHGGGDYSVYGSLARIDVQKGQAVAKTQRIGSVGAADPELPPHLHFEVRPNGRAVDPLEWLRGRRPTSR